MRHEKGENLLHLALEMQAARHGLSLADIERRFGVGRRTAMRMRDAVLRLFPQAEEVPQGDRVRRWRLPSGTLDRLLAVPADELATLESAIKLMEDHNRPLEAATLAGLAAKLKAVMPAAHLRRVEPDLEALLEAEGLACRPGPRPRLDPQVIDTLRQALKAGRAVRLTYGSRRAPEPTTRVVHPYGFLHGHRHYLVGRQSAPARPEVRLYSFPRITAAEALDLPLERDPDFDLAAFARRAFGVFQEAPQQVVWRFAPSAAEEARSFLFHPDQTLEAQPDGGLVVRFTAGGLLEMAWYLYTWGEAVEVLEPPELAALVHPHRRAWGAVP
ncbi:helix-turn-helix transcriptional regulator [Roseospirillum parvum]|uniref:Predicted DNA-binding transcriptional regulator YafY, contains an HTH and WYL domains n=1 Tax=Roseospirillum parvum TaxID=83401 RepID=A0A1G8EE67_9PROT|nr:WYL domain-containing protein [Roseospirillum parvum]SDH68174.1 Predicted DNA-binding transcriptional regulator YafY, contains an HTH and WYL domains [Roseospirillum parvum]